MSEELKATNWPNPERIGATCSPPENTKSETWHWLDCGYLTPFAWRDHDGGAWWSNDGEDHLFSPQQMAQLGWRYVGPVLTPTQIAEMLAGERERCAKEAENHRSNANPHTVGEWDIVQSSTANGIAHAIRNLGDAP